MRGRRDGQVKASTKGTRRVVTLGGRQSRGRVDAAPRAPRKYAGNVDTDKAACPNGGASADVNLSK